MTMHSTICGTTFHEGGIYDTRSGLKVEITSVRDGFLFGHSLYWRVDLQWRYDGRRTPVGGQDPFDLILP